RLYSLYCSGHHLDLHSFPTRRSSDLPFDGEISNAQLRSMLARHFGPEYVHSASGLSTYGNCAFRFFDARVLKREPRNEAALDLQDRKSTRLNSSHDQISYAVFCLKKK